MDFAVLAQQMINGLVNGMSYVLIATGLTLVFGVLRIINFAHGEFYMLGAYLTYYAVSLAGLDYAVAAALATLLVAGLGILANRVFFWPLRREHEFTILESRPGAAALERRRVPVRRRSEIRRQPARRRDRRSRAVGRD
jgi:branched-chain amino acid transport system permease protein